MPDGARGAYFDEVDGAFEPAPQASGPWADDMLHGRFLGGLGVRALQLEHGAPGRRVARLTVDMFRPAAMKPVRVRTELVRNGRRITLADAILSCDGHDVGRVTALFLAEGDEPPGRVWQPDRLVWPDPETIDRLPETPPDSQWIFRQVSGSMDSADRTRVWCNDTFDLVAGEPMSPLVRAATSGDLASPMANSGDHGLFYINADYTMQIARYPEGPWIGIESAEHLASDGIAIASVTLVDAVGAFAHSSVTALARPKFER